MIITAKVLLPLPFDVGFDYLIPPDRDFEVGELVEVPFGKKILIGVILEFSEISDEKLEKKLKYIISSLNEKEFSFYKLPENLIEFITKQSNYYYQPRGLSLGLCYNKKFFKELKRKPKEKELKIKPAKKQEIELNSEQEIAYHNILSHTQSFSVTLLDGVTGSGKTEVFFKLTEEFLKQGKQVLIMLPEIFLTSQVINRYEGRFLEGAAIWHSNITEAKKRKYFFDIAKGKINVVIGARSALHLPFKNLGLIVCDEEHDNSYKQDDGVVYNARDMAILRGKIENIPVVLSSATPSLETILNVKNNKYHHEKLTTRYSQVLMPKIDIIDMRQDKVPANKFISQKLQSEMAKTLSDNQQVMLFLNRRGYAPLTICDNCGFRFKSPDTSAWMVLHYERSGKPYLLCHHSGYRIDLPEECPECKAENSFRSCGPGTQRVHEEVKELFPEANILEINSDTLTSKKMAENFFHQINSGEADIIIGTQIIAKGYHFPKLKMVGVVDADLGLDFMDLRASEKVFQALQQVSGRAGREEKQGKVYLQTYEPENTVLQAVKNYDRERFLEHELDVRKKGDLPPFSKFVAIIVSAQDNIKALEFAREVSRYLIHTEGVKILGPAEAVYHELRGWFRYRFLIKCQKNYNISHYLDKSFENLKIPNYIRLKVDIDPYNFF